jgi:aminoglycoside 2''-phosphotransferase
MLKDSDISARDAEHLNRIRECFPRLAVESVESNQDGLTNDVLIINGELVCRFPKNETWARDLLANELKVIDLARGYLNVPIPEIVYRAADFVACRFIRGSALQRNDILSLSEIGQEAIANQLASYLKQLHGIPLEEVERHGIARSDTNRSHEVWVKLFESVKAELFPLMMPHAREWVVKHFAPLIADERLMDYEPRLINGDTTPYHILFDHQAQKINGIIDFGTAGLGDRAADFACVIYFYGESFLRRMAKFYPEIEEGIERARFWAGALELQWTLSGLRAQGVNARGAKWAWFTAHLGSARDVMPGGFKWSKT